MVASGHKPIRCVQRNMRGSFVVIVCFLAQGINIIVSFVFHALYSMHTYAVFQ